MVRYAATQLLKICSNGRCYSRWWV